MPMTKVVNGERVEMTPKEEQAHLATHPPTVPVPLPPSDADVICEALKAKNVLTDADIKAARQRLQP